MSSCRELDHRDLLLLPPWYKTCPEYCSSWYSDMPGPVACRVAFFDDVSFSTIVQGGCLWSLRMGVSARCLKNAESGQLEKSRSPTILKSNGGEFPCGCFYRVGASEGS